MKVEKREGSKQRIILTAMLVDPSVLGRIAAKWDGAMFKAKWCNLIGKWCVDYHGRYGKAPGKQVEGLFAAWADKHGDQDTIDLVEKFLTSLSGKYAARRKEINPDYVVDLAGDYFNQVKLEKLAEALQGDLSTGDLEEAQKRVAKFDRIEVGSKSFINYFTDKAAHARTFAPQSREVLIEYGGPLGKFFKDLWSRDQFVAFEGPEKRGKCVAGSTKVQLADGRVRSIKQLVESKDLTPIISLDERTGRFVPVQVSEFWDNGIKECWEVRTRSGRRVTTTANHQYLTSSGWKVLEEVRLGDFVAVPKKASFFGTATMDCNEVRFLAYMIADGGCTSDQATFTKTDPGLNSGFDKCCKALNIGVRIKGISRHLLRCGDLRRKYPEALWKVSSKNKRIPDCIFQCPKKQVAEFLRVLFSCDGFVLKNGEIGITLANRFLIRQIGHLLIRFGIVHVTKPTNKKLNGKVFKAWSILIRDKENQNRFLKRINFLSYKYRHPFKVQKRKSFIDKIPWQVAERICSEVVSEPEVRSGVLGSVREQIVKRLPLMRQSFERIRGTKTHNKYLNSHVLWDEVVSIRKVGPKHTYDLSVPIHHNFLAGDCVVHNTFWLQEIAWRAVVQGRRTAFFEIGDLSEDQIMERLNVRMAGRPYEPTPKDEPILYPLELKRVGKRMKVVKTETYRFHKALTEKEEWRAVRRWRRKVRDPNLFRVETHPNDTLSVSGLESTLRRWERGGWVPDVICLDYADLIAAPPGYQAESREAINHNWKRMRSICQQFHCLFVTATQTNASSYGAKTLGMSHFSEDKRKRGHTTATVGINQDDKEKEQQIQSLNIFARRKGKYNPLRKVYVAGCLELAQVAVVSAFNTKI